MANNLVVFDSQDVGKSAEREYMSGRLRVALQPLEEESLLSPKA
jgi:hypothetical protein